MKRILLTTVGILFTVFLFAQNTISFYTNNGTKKVTQIKCGEFDNIKVKFDIPKSIKNYDKVTLFVHLSSINVSANITYIGKGDIGILTSKSTLEKWILKPGKKAGDFTFGNVNLKDKDLCEYPRENGYANLELTVSIGCYTKTGQETKWDKWSKSYKTKNVYSKATWISEGKLNIKQGALDMVFTDKDANVSVEKVAKDPSKESVKNSFAGYLSLYNLKSSEEGLVSFPIYIYNDKEIEKKVQEAMNGRLPAGYNSFEFIKQDILQKIANNTFVEKKNYGSSYSFLKVYKKNTLKLPKELDHAYCPKIQSVATEKKKGKKKNSFKGLMNSLAENTSASKTESTKPFEAPNMWKKEKIGDYDYDVLRIPETYCEVNWNTQTTPPTKKDDAQAAEMVIYAIHRADLTFIIIPSYQNYTYGNNVFHIPDVKQQKEFVQKTMKTVKLLK